MCILVITGKGIGCITIRESRKIGCVKGMEQPEPAGGIFHGYRSINLLPDEVFSSCGIIPAPFHGFRHVIDGCPEVGCILKVDVLDDAPVGDHDYLVVRDPLRGPDGTGLFTPGGPFIAYGKDFQHPGLFRISNDNRL